MSLQPVLLLSLGALIIAVLPQGQEPTLAVRGTQIDVDLYGNLYVLDSDRNMLRLYDKNGLLRREVGGAGWQNDQFDRPLGVWARNGIDVFVADYGNHRIQRFDRSLAFVSSLSTRESGNPEERFGYPTDVALSRLGELFVCDSENSRIVKIDRSDRVERSFGGFGGGKGRLFSPTSLEIGPKDALYVLDGKRIAVFDAFGNYLRDLAPGLFAAPTTVYGDPARLIVHDGGTLYFFDADERPAGAVAVETLMPANGSVRSLAAKDTTLWLLTDRGIISVPDPQSKIQIREP